MWFPNAWNVHIVSWWLYHSLSTFILFYDRFEHIEESTFQRYIICGIFLQKRHFASCLLRPRGISLSNLFHMSGLFQMNPNFIFVMICHLLERYEIVGNCILIYRSCSLNSNWRHAAALRLACMESRPGIYVFTVDITAFSYKCWNVLLQRFGHTSNTRRTPICRPDGWAIGIIPVLCGEKWPWDVRSALYRGANRRISRLVLFWHRMN